MKKYYFIVISILSLTFYCFILLSTPGEKTHNFPDRFNELFNDQEIKTAVWYYNLETGESFGRNQNMSFEAASLIKIPVMLASLEAINNNEISLKTKLKVENRFLNRNGQYFTIPEKALISDTLSPYLDTKVTIKDLINHMIVDSSNLAANIIIKTIGMNNIEKKMNELKATDIRLSNYIFDIKSYNKKIINKISAKSIGELLVKIARLTLPLY